METLSPMRQRGGSSVHSLQPPLFLSVVLPVAESESERPKLELTCKLELELELECLS